MDTSLTYVKLCQKAKEIQDTWKPYEGDFYYSDNWEASHPLIENQVRLGVDHENWSGKINLLWQRNIWLPRQDQLQEMINPAGNIQLALHHLIAIADFWIGRDIKSMEQLWLAFVMHEKYRKSWNGKEWIKEGNND